MESQAPTNTTIPTTFSQPSEPQPPQQQSSQPPQPQPQRLPPVSLPPSSSSAPSVSAPVTSSQNPNPIQNQSQNPNSKPPTPLPHQSAPCPPPPRPPSTFTRTLPQQQQQQSHFPHFSSPLSSLPSSPGSASSGSSLPSTGSPSVSGAQPPRGGMAIGVPAPHHSPSPPFSSSFGQHFGGLGRGGVNVPESASTSNAAQARTPMQGMQGMGTVGSLGSSSQIRPGGIPSHHQQRPVQSSLRPPSAPNNQSTNSQSFQGHGIMRTSSVGSPASSSPNVSQSMQSHTQPWLSSGPQGKPPLPSPSYRQQLNSQTLQQRSHIPQPQQHPLPSASQQQHMSSMQQQQPSPSNQSQEPFGQQVPTSRAAQPLPHQPQITRVQGVGNQKPSSLAMAQPGPVALGTQNRFANADADESCHRILSKRSISELVNQVDPSEKMDPEVEDILVDIAEDFVESITRFGCSLAKHRKSTTLEAKDILLHLEKNWNMTLPGFGGDEIKGYRRPLTSEIHKERLAAIKKSVSITEGAHIKNSSGQAAGNAKGSLAKPPANILGSPNFKNA
ncbi:transcription initiation factor TFIID subunit 12 [Quillaja saponaria]|uniref:Transcription initiation factor TFIID subunit 12 n=1 Tax=Quillaja saponaria TaxID=32244 RepID=A0AAD7PYM2_QUISA|nr:transcription initiation factor TFIID subunit 12 [Quillaja saponaria]KAJ7971534.1 transcription initiation factor TFIID subunit 12 [Quillaja saponaria]